MVPFAVVCDLCGSRGEEYTGGPTCQECLADVCRDCVARVVRDADEGQNELVICKRCEAAAC